MGIMDAAGRSAGLNDDDAAVCREIRADESLAVWRRGRDGLRRRCEAAQAPPPPGAGTRRAYNRAVVAFDTTNQPGPLGVVVPMPPAPAPTPMGLDGRQHEPASADAIDQLDAIISRQLKGGTIRPETKVTVLVVDPKTLKTRASLRESGAVLLAPAADLLAAESMVGVQADVAAAAGAALAGSQDEAAAQVAQAEMPGPVAAIPVNKDVPLGLGAISGAQPKHPNPVPGSRVPAPEANPCQGGGLLGGALERLLHPNRQQDRSGRHGMPRPGVGLPGLADSARIDDMLLDMAPPEITQATGIGTSGLSAVGIIAAQQRQMEKYREMERGLLAMQQLQFEQCMRDAVTTGLGIAHPGLLSREATSSLLSKLEQASQHTGQAASIRFMGLPLEFRVSENIPAGQTYVGNQAAAGCGNGLLLVNGIGEPAADGNAQKG